MLGGGAVKPVLDYTGDGAADLLAVTTGGALRIYPGNGAGGWRPTIHVYSNWGNMNEPIAMGDFNGDGHADVGVIMASGNFDIRYGRGNGTFGPPVQIGQEWSSMTAIIGNIDFDGDGRLDIIARRPNGELVLYRGAGNGRFFGTVQVIGYGWNGMKEIFSVGDFTGDGNPDVLAVRDDNKLFVYPTSGRGTWQAREQVNTWNWGGLDPVLSPGDFTGDGNPDVLARSTADGRLLLYPSNGEGFLYGGRQVGTAWNTIAWIS